MSNYTQTTNFATKDALASGNPLKIVKGTEINTEFANIATAVATKADSASPTFTGTTTINTLSVTGTTTLTGVATVSSNPILSAGTANGVAFLNGSKAVTTGTDLVFDGTNLGIGQSTPIANFRLATLVSADSSAGLHVENTNTGTSASAISRFKNSGTTFAYAGIGGTGRAAQSGVLGANVLALYTDNAAGAGVLVDAAGPITFGTNSALRASITSDGAWNFGASGTNTGTVGQSLLSQGSASSPTWGSSISLATVVASTSGTSIDFTSIPSWVRRITVMFVGVSTTGASKTMVQIGDSGGIETSGYLGSVSFADGSASAENFSSGFVFSMRTGGTTVVRHGMVVLSLVDSSSNSWVEMGNVGDSDTTAVTVSGGSKALSATLDRVRITTIGGTDTFDAGSINIQYE